VNSFTKPEVIGDADSVMKQSFSQGAQGLGDSLQALNAASASPLPESGGCERRASVISMYSTISLRMRRATAYLVDYCWLSSSI